MANAEGTMRGRCSKAGRPPGGPCIRRHGNPSGTERREPRARQLATSAPIKLFVCTSHDPAPIIVNRAIVWYLVVVVVAAAGRGAEGRGGAGARFADQARKRKQKRKCKKMAASG